MGFLDFLGNGGSGLITGIANTVTGAVQNKQALAWQKEQWKQQMDYGREMWEKQNQAESDRMALQNQWNKEAAAQSQQYAKEMFDYTGYENQVKQMKAAGLNPALMNGGGGSAGQASAGAEVQPAQAFQPMGIQMALQAQQVMANTQLANAQAEKTRAEATAQNMQNLIGSSVDLVQKIGEIGRTKQEKKNLEGTYTKTLEEVKKVQEEVNNLKLQGDVLKENKELLEFQNGVNKLIKSGVYYDTKGAKMDWQQSVILRYFGSIGRDVVQWEKDEQQALFDKGVLERLMKDIDAIATGKANEFSLSGMKFDLMQKEWERADFELEQDKAASKLLDEITGEGEYARLLGKFLKVLLRYLK
nr:MAG TPA_asm: minor capsid protein [Microviridae sp.]